MAWGNAYPRCVISVWTMLAYILYAIIPNEVCDADDINACREHFWYTDDGLTLLSVCLENVLFEHHII